MVNTIIAKANSKDKVIDFRDGLVLANQQDYAMMHGVGGKDYAPVSVIKVTICDFTAGTGDKSVTVQASIRPEICDQLLEVCKKNLGSQPIINTHPLLEEQRAFNRKLNKTADMLFGILTSVLTILERVVSAAEKNQMPGKAVIAASVQKRLAKIQQRALEAEEQPERPPFVLLDHRTDFNYTQDRVHVQKKDANGFAPVQRLQIFRKTYADTEGMRPGTEYKYPWQVRITNGRAEITVRDTGATTFNPSTLTDVTEAFIPISDADMYRMMYRVNHFISAWENLAAIPLIKKGEAQREAERQDYLARMEEGV